MYFTRLPPQGNSHASEPLEVGIWVSRRAVKVSLPTFFPCEENACAEVAKGKVSIWRREYSGRTLGTNERYLCSTFHVSTFNTEAVRLRRCRSRLSCVFWGAISHFATQEVSPDMPPQSCIWGRSRWIPDLPLRPQRMLLLSANAAPKGQDVDGGTGGAGKRPSCSGQIDSLHRPALSGWREGGEGDPHFTTFVKDFSSRSPPESPTPQHSVRLVSSP